MASLQSVGLFTLRNFFIVLKQCELQFNSLIIQFQFEKEYYRLFFR